MDLLVTVEIHPKETVTMSWNIFLRICYLEHYWCAWTTAQIYHANVSTDPMKSEVAHCSDASGVRSHI